MVFSSPAFLFFFLPAVYLVCRVLPGIRSRNAWLAAASLVFYAAGQSAYALLLLLSAAMNYLAGLLLMRGRAKKAVLAVFVAGNLLLLGTFKYLDFFVRTLNAAAGLSLPETGITLPIGISFYTFQGLSYVIDVYRDPRAGTKRFGKLLLYIAFFPQLIAGPIIKYHDIERQLDERGATPELTLLGLRRFIAGLGKKLLCADTLGAVASAVFAMGADELDMRLAWLGAVCYTLQIYFDFSGYSDMAVGLGALFGFTLPENFRLPYTALSVREFWRRWHITLSAWFRDYLYIPLGGNRAGRARTVRNKVIVFALTGLWHGANWTFLLWGLWHGAFASLEDAGVVPKRLTRSRFGHVYTMLVVVPGFVLFRADTLADAARMLSQMFAGVSFTAAHTLALRALLDARTAFVLLAAALLAVGAPQRLMEMSARRFPRAHRCAGAAAYAAVLALCVLAMANMTFSPFIYYQF